MPSIKELARTVVRKNWPVSDAAFNALWTTLAEAPNPDLLIREQSSAPALGAGSGSKDPVLLLVMIALIIEEYLGSEDKELQAIYPLFDRVVEKYGHKGIIGRSKKTLAREFASTTLVTPTRFRVYTNDKPNGRRVTGRIAGPFRKKRDTCDIFIEHELALTYDKIGQMYVKGRAVHAGAKRFSAHEYRVVRYLLIHASRQSERSLPDLVEHCWPSTSRHEDAQALRERQRADPTAFTAYTSGHRAFIIELNKKLAEKGVGSAIHSERTKIYAFTPRWPDYCVVDEE